MKQTVYDTAEQIFKQYESGRKFKETMYDGKGLYAQNRKNERFYSGDQWYGAAVGGDRPLVRLNIIKRIGDYKTAMVSAAPISVSYTAEGVASGEYSSDKEIEGIISDLSGYYRTTAERVKFSQKAADALRRAYISGTGILYTAWDPSIDTGLYADRAKKEKIKGDIVTEVIDAENFYLGEPNSDCIETQPYIIVAQRRTLDSIKREARFYGKSEEVIASITSDNDSSSMAGDFSDREPSDGKRATVLTKFFKEYLPDGSITVKAIKAVKGAVLRDEWDTHLRVYPFAVICWNRRLGCGYGESEIASLIPNQIAINRMATATVWSQMMTGMPIMVVNDEVITDAVSNEPGQVIYSHGDITEGAIGYVNPPSVSSAYSENLSRLIIDTLTQSGANDAALGDISANNTSAIIAVREAATVPLQAYQNSYYQFIEDNARIWAEYWVTLYGNRQIKITDENGTKYVPFDAEKCRALVLGVRVDVGSASVWSEAQSVKTLDSLLAAGIITPKQYLKRLPKGYVPDAGSLADEIESEETENDGQTDIQ